MITLKPLTTWRSNRSGGLRKRFSARRSSTITGAFDSKVNPSCDFRPVATWTEPADPFFQPMPALSKRALPVGSSSMTLQNSQPRIAGTRRTASSNSVAEHCAFQGALTQSRKSGLLAGTGFERNHGVRALRGQFRSALGDARFQLLARLA